MFKWFKFKYQNLFRYVFNFIKRLLRKRFNENNELFLCYSLDNVDINIFV